MISQHDVALAMIQTEVLSGETEASRQFLLQFRSEIDECNSRLAAAFVLWQELDRFVERNERLAYHSAFSYYAIDQLAISLQLLIKGHVVSAGNLARQSIEAIAMMLLCAECVPQYLLRFIEDHFNAKDALTHLKRNQKKLKIENAVIGFLQRSYQHFHQYSHATKLSLAEVISLEEEGRLFFGAAFDPGKVAGYRKEFRNRISLAVLLGELLARDPH